MKGSFDIAVVGSGFGGSLTALIARRLGRSVVLLEKGTHPRFAIGESSSPLANLLLDELARRYELPRILPLTKWGTWQRTYPEIGCGLKRGFTFYGHRLGRPFAADPDRRDQLLVAASPHDEIADTHWHRPDFDHFLVREAQAEGVEYLDRTSLDRVTWTGGSAMLDGERPGERLSIRARFVVDASGPRGFLHRALGLRETPFGTVPATQGLYTHFSDVRRLESMGIFSSKEPLPYPVDDAALHHVFDGGWIWVLRFNNGITSAGVAATDRLSDELRLADSAPAWDRLTARLPTVREQFAQARPLFPFIYASRLPFRSERAAGPSWALLPSAAAFVDPLLSTGFPLTLLGIQRLARAVEKDWNSSRFASQLDVHAERTFFEVDTAARLVGALYANFHDFPLFTALSLLYFAAASFTETARRLSRPELAGSFLCGGHALFGPALRRCCESALRGAAPGGLAPDQRDALIQDVFQAIEPLDVVGLSDLSRRNWYSVDARDLLCSADKLGASREEIEELLSRSGFFPKRIKVNHSVTVPGGCLMTRHKETLKVEVGAPVMIDQYQGSETDANEQTHHFCGLIRAGNGNLIALYSLRRDAAWPKDVPMREFLKKNVGYRISTDNGRTWSQQRELDYGGVDGGSLSDGAILIPTSWSTSSWWVDEHEMRVMMNRSTDGGLTWTRDEDVRVRFPADRTLRRYPSACPGDPDRSSMGFWVGPIIPVDRATALATMSGPFAETAPFRRSDQCSSILIQSQDGGRSWEFVSCIAGDKPSGHRGFFGTAMSRLANGDLLCVVQTEDAEPRIMVQCWSHDGGKTWTEPIPVPGLPVVDPIDRHYTTPDGVPCNFNGAYHHPVLARLDNGVLALAYGRPGIQVAFNLDGTGRFWEEIVEIVPRAAPYSYGPYDVTSGKPGLVPIGPDRLFLVYDVYNYAERSTDPRLNTVFARELKVRKTGGGAA